MTVIRGGEMAFPLHNTGHGEPYDEGMTLRDYFAAKAMGICPLLSHYDSSRWCYERADAMMRHRDSGE
jgi:hypothetical protein